ncbi:uncharacterized protein LOC144870658 isoform X2 [Branchiostoma floridae x Branchiostoma japonicum]
MAAAGRLVAILAIVLSDFAFKSADSFIPQTQRCVDASCREAISQGRARKSYRSADPRLLSFNIHDVITVFSKEADKNGLWGGVVAGKEDKFGYFRKDALVELNIFHTSLPHIVPTKEALQGNIQEEEDDTSHGHPQDHLAPGSEGEDPRTMHGRGDPSVQRSQVPNEEEGMVQYMGQEGEDHGAKPVRVQWEPMNYGDPSEQVRQNGAPPQEQQHGIPHHEESHYEVPYHVEEGHPEQRTGGLQHDVPPSHQQHWPQGTPPEAQHGTSHQEDPSPYGIHHQHEQRDHGHPHYEHGENQNIHEESSQQDDYRPDTRQPHWHGPGPDHERVQYTHTDRQRDRHDRHASHFYHDEHYRDSDQTHTHHTHEHRHVRPHEQHVPHDFRDWEDDLANHQHDQEILYHHQQQQKMDETMDPLLLHMMATDKVQEPDEADHFEERIEFFFTDDDLNDMQQPVDMGDVWKGRTLKSVDVEEKDTKPVPSVKKQWTEEELIASKHIYKTEITSKDEEEVDVKDEQEMVNQGQPGLEENTQEFPDIEGSLKEQTETEEDKREPLEIQEGLKEQTESEVDSKEQPETDLKEQTGTEEDSKEQTGTEEDSKEQTGTEEDSKEQAGTEEDSKEQTGTEEGGKEQTGTEEDSKEQTGTEEDSKEQTGTEDDSKEQTWTEEDSKEQAGTGEDSKEQTGTEEDSKEQTGTGEDSKEQTGTEDDSKEQTGTEEDNKEQTGTEEDSEEQTGTEEDSKEQTGTEEDNKEQTGTEEDSKEQTGTDEDSKGQAGTAEDSKGQTGTEEDSKEQTGTEDDSKEQAGTEEDNKEQTGTKEDSKEQTGTEEDSRQQTGTEEDSRQQTGTEEDSRQQTGTEEDSKEQTGTEEDSKEQTGTEDDSKEQTGTEDDSKEQTGTEKDSKEQTGTEDDSKEQTGTEEDSKEQTGTEEDLNNQAKTEHDGQGQSETEGNRKEQSELGDPGEETETEGDVKEETETIGNLKAQTGTKEESRLEEPANDQPDKEQQNSGLTPKHRYMAVMLKSKDKVFQGTVLNEEDDTDIGLSDEAVEDGVLLEVKNVVSKKESQAAEEQGAMEGAVADELEAEKRGRTTSQKDFLPTRSENPSYVSVMHGHNRVIMDNHWLGKDSASPQSKTAAQFSSARSDSTSYIIAMLGDHHHKPDHPLETERDIHPPSKDAETKITGKFTSMQSDRPSYTSLAFGNGVVQKGSLLTATEERRVDHQTQEVERKSVESLISNNDDSATHLSSMLGKGMGESNSRNTYSQVMTGLYWTGAKSSSKLVMTFTPLADDDKETKVLQKDPTVLGDHVPSPYVLPKVLSEGDLKLTYLQVMGLNLERMSPTTLTISAARAMKSTYKDVGQPQGSAQDVFTVSGDQMMPPDTSIAPTVHASTLTYMQMMTGLSEGKTLPTSTKLSEGTVTSKVEHVKQMDEIDSGDEIPTLDITHKDPTEYANKPTYIQVITSLYQSQMASELAIKDHKPRPEDVENTNQEHELADTWVKLPPEQSSTTYLPKAPTETDPNPTYSQVLVGIYHSQKAPETLSTGKDMSDKTEENSSEDDISNLSALPSVSKESSFRPTYPHVMRESHFDQTAHKAAAVSADTPEVVVLPISTPFVVKDITLAKTPRATYTRIMATLHLKETADETPTQSVSAAEDMVPKQVEHPVPTTKPSQISTPSKPAKSATKSSAKLTYSQTVESILTDQSLSSTKNVQRLDQTKPVATDDKDLDQDLAEPSAPVSTDQIASSILSKLPPADTTISPTYSKVMMELYKGHITLKTVTPPLPVHEAMEDMFKSGHSAKPTDSEHSAKPTDSEHSAKLTDSKHSAKLTYSLVMTGLLKAEKTSKLLIHPVPTAFLTTDKESRKILEVAERGEEKVRKFPTGSSAKPTYSQTMAVMYSDQAVPEISVERLSKVALDTDQDQHITETIPSPDRKECLPTSPRLPPESTPKSTYSQVMTKTFQDYMGKETSHQPEVTSDSTTEAISKPVSKPGQIPLAKPHAKSSAKHTYSQLIQSLHIDESLLTSSVGTPKTTSTVVSQEDQTVQTDITVSGPDPVSVVITAPELVVKTSHTKAISTSWSQYLEVMVKPHGFTVSTEPLLLTPTSTQPIQTDMDTDSDSDGKTKELESAKEDGYQPESAKHTAHSIVTSSKEEHDTNLEQKRSHRKKVKVKTIDATDEDKDLSSMGVEAAFSPERPSPGLDWVASGQAPGGGMSWYTQLLEFTANLNDYLESLYKDMGDDEKESQQQDAGTEQKNSVDEQEAKTEEEQREDKEGLQQQEKEDIQQEKEEDFQQEDEEVNREEREDEEEKEGEDEEDVEQEDGEEVGKVDDKEGNKEGDDEEELKWEDQEEVQQEEEEEVQTVGEEDAQTEDQEKTQLGDVEDTQREAGEDTQQEDREEDTQQEGGEGTQDGGEDMQQEGGEDTQQEGREEDTQKEGGEGTQDGGEDTQQEGGEDTQQEGGEDTEQDCGEDTEQERGEDTEQEGGEDMQQEDRKEDTQQEDEEDRQQEDEEDTQQQEELEGADGEQKDDDVNKEELDGIDYRKQEGNVEEEEMGDDEEDDEGDDEEREEEDYGGDDREEDEEEDDQEDEALDDTFFDVEEVDEKDGKDIGIEKAEHEEDEHDKEKTGKEEEMEVAAKQGELEDNEEKTEDGKDIDSPSQVGDREIQGENGEKEQDTTEEPEEELMEDENAIAANQLHSIQEQEGSEEEQGEEKSKEHQEEIVSQGDAPAEDNMDENQASDTEEQSAQLEKQDQVPKEEEDLSQHKELSSDEESGATESPDGEETTEEEEQLEDVNAAAASGLKEGNIEEEGLENGDAKDIGTLHDQSEDENKESRGPSSIDIEETFDGIVEDQNDVPGEKIESSDGIIEKGKEPLESDMVENTESDSETTGKDDLDIMLEDNVMKDEQEATDELFKDLKQKSLTEAGVDDLDGLSDTKMDEASASEVEPDVEKLLETPELKEIRDKLMDMTGSITAKTRERTETLLGQLESKLSFATADATDVNSQDDMEENLILEPGPEVKDEQEEDSKAEEKVNTDTLFPFGSGENARQQLREQVEKLTKSDGVYQKQQERLRQEMLDWTAKMKEKREEARKAKENKGETVIDGTTIVWDEVLDDDVAMSTEDLPFDWDEVLDKEAFMSEYSQIMGQPFGEDIMPTSVQSSPDSMLSTPVVDMKTEATASSDDMVIGDLEKDVAKPGMQQLLQGSEVSPDMGETDSIGAVDPTTIQPTEPLQSAHITETSVPSEQATAQTPQYILPDEPARGYGWDGRSTERTLNLYLEGAKPEQVIDKVGLDSEKLDALRAEEEEKEEEVAPDQTDAADKEQPTSEPATASELEADEYISKTDTEDIYIVLDFQFLEMLGALVPPEWAEQLRGWGLEYTPNDLIFQGIPIPWLAVVTTLLVGIVTFCVFSYKCVTRCVHGKPVDPAVVKKQLEAEIDKAAKEKEDLRKGAEAAEDRIRELEETLDVEKFSAQALSKKNSELEEKLSSNDQLEVTLRQEIQRLMDQVSEAREQLESTSSEYAKQQEIEAEYKKNLKKERKEKEKIQDRLTEIESKTKHLDSEMVNIKEHRDLLEESKRQLEEEIQGRQEQFSELKESIELIKQENEQLKENVQYKENEIEALQVLRDCLMQIKALESEDAAAVVEEDSEDASTAKDEKIQQMLDVARINSTLKLVESERDYLRSRLEEADGSRKEYEDKTDRLQMQVDNLSEARKRAEKQYYEAQVRLNTLQDYFKEKEVELQRKLGKEEMIRQDVSGKVQDTQEKYRLAKEQVELYQNQKDDLLKEMQESERSFRNQIASIEKKAHESWMAARTSEREAQDSKREAATLRQKLLEVENALAKEKDKYLMQSPPLIKPTPINGPPPFPPRFSPPLLPPGAPRHGPPFGRSPPPGRNGDFDGPPSPPPEMAFRGPPPPMGPPPLGPPPFRGPPDDFPDRDFDHRSRPSSERDFPPDRDFDRRPPSEPFGHPDFGPGPHRGPPMDFPPPRGGPPPMTPPDLRRGSGSLPPMPMRGPPSSGRMSGPRELRGPPRRPDEESGSQDSRSTGPPSPPPMGIPRTSSPLDSPQHYMGPPPPGGPPPQHFSPHGPPPPRRSPNPPPMGRRPPPSDEDRRDRSRMPP